VDGTSLRKTVVVPLADIAGGTFGSMTATSNAGVQGSVRGRLGIAFDRALLYGTGGVAITSFNTSYFDTTGFFTGVPGTNATISNTRAGFTFGGGIEYAVTIIGRCGRNTAIRISVIPLTIRSPIPTPLCSHLAAMLSRNII